MNQNDLQSLANAPAVPPGLAGAARTRGEQAEAPARGARSRPTSSDTARSTAQTTGATAAPGPDLLVPIAAPPDATPATDLVYEAAEDGNDDAGAQLMREEAAADARREEEMDRTEAKRDAEQDAEREAMLIQDEATQPVDPEALLVIDPDEPPPGSGQRSGKAKRRAIGGAALAAGFGSAARAMLEESGDRLHRIAVVAHLQLQELRAPRPGRASLVNAAPPKNRAACLRRCGHDGFCDPSDPLGCGGVHCGQTHDMLY